MADHEDRRVLRQFAERINEALDDMGIPPMQGGRAAELGRLLKMTPRGAANYLNGERMPRPKDHERIAQRLNVRLEWLFYGLGPKRAGRSKKRLPTREQRRVMENIIMAVDHCVPLAELELDRETRACLISKLYFYLVERMEESGGQGA